MGRDNLYERMHGLPKEHKEQKIEEKLLKLKNLFDSGLISEKEYQDKKLELLNQF